MGPPSSPLATGYPGYLDVSAGMNYMPTRGYGWVAGDDLQNADRGIGTALTRDRVQAPDETFAVDLRNGTYTVIPTIGNVSNARGPLTVFLDGQQVGTVTIAAGQVATPQYTVQVTSGQLTVRIAGQNNDWGLINGLNIFAASDSLNQTGILPTRQTSAPSATFATSGSVNEGGTGTVSFTHTTGGIGPYTYSYGFSNDGTFQITGSTQATVAIPAQYLADPGPK